MKYLLFILLFISFGSYANEAQWYDINMQVMVSKIITIAIFISIIYLYYPIIYRYINPTRAQVSIQCCCYILIIAITIASLLWFRNQQSLLLTQDSSRLIFLLAVIFIYGLHFLFTYGFINLDEHKPLMARTKTIREGHNHDTFILPISIFIFFTLINPSDLTIAETIILSVLSTCSCIAALHSNKALKRRHFAAIDAYNEKHNKP